MAIGEGGADQGVVSPDLGLPYLTDVVQIGRGGFAYVFAATDTRFDRRVAVKVFDQLLADDDQVLFETECRTTGRLSGVPNIITVHDVDFTADGRPCIVMAHIPGGSLGDQLRGSGLIPWRRAVGYVITILTALDEAHRRGVLHRDIKPENILIDDDRVFLTDFGLATVKAGPAADPAASNVIASPLHAPPETFDGGIRDERSDVYSAGSTLYNLIVGHAPFQRHADLSTEAIVERLRTEPPAHLPAGLAPPELDALLQRTLAKDPAERPQTAAELADALRTILDGVPAPPVPDASAPSSPDAGGGPSPAVILPARSAVTQSGPHPGASAPPAAGGGAPTPAPLASTPPVPTPPSASPWGTGAAPTAAGGQRAISRREGALAALVVVLMMGAIIGVVAATRPSEPNRPTIARRPSPTASPSTSTSSTAPAIDRNRALSEVGLLSAAETRWSDDRAQVVTEIAANGWGWDQESQTVSGPGGLLVDLSTCPSVWDPYRGVGATTVEVRQIPAGDVTADLADEAAGFRAYFDHLNQHGGVTDPGGSSRQVVVTDGGLDSGVIPRFLKADDVDAFATRTITDGAVETLAGDLGSACVPDPFVPSAGPGWSDPSGQPWAWADRLSAEVEGRLLGETLLRSLPDPAGGTMVALVSDDDVGRATEQALRRFLARSDLPDTLLTVEVDHRLEFLDEEVKLLDTGPDALVLIAGTTEACARMTGAVIGHGLPAATTVVMQTTGCGPSQPGASLGDAGPGVSWLAVGRPHRAPQPDDAWISWAESVLNAAGLGRYPSPAALEGFASGWSLHQTLLIAGELPGGLSRPNLLVAARALRLGHPGLVDGVSYGMQGGLDADLIEGAPILRYDPDGLSWVPSGNGVFDVAGLTPPCRWDPGQRLCV